MSEPQSPRRGIVLGTQKAAAPAASSDEPIIKSVPFPADRVYRWTANSAEAPDVALVVTQEVMLAVNQHVSESLAKEIGGFLLGNRCRCPVTHRDYVIIDQFSPAAGTEATSVSVAFTAESWGKLSEELRGKFLGKFLVGWYHSHPKMSVFLSEHDVQIHEQRFSDDWMSALVLEPQKQLGGFFSRRKGRLDPNVVVEFYELLPPSRETVMPWKNYVCHDPLTNQDLDPPRNAGLPAPAAGTSTGQELEPSHQAGQVSEPFPSERTYHWVPAAAAANPPLEVAMVLSQEVLEGVNRCVSASLEIEIGGFLLGNRYRCPNSGRNYVIIDQYSPAQFTEATGVSLSFTPEAWGKLHDELRGKFLGKLLVGWYHSHPRMGIFLSSWDVILHDQRFSEPWMSALVIDPEKQEGGLFCRVAGRLDPRIPVDFYEYVGVAGGPSVIRWHDHTCRDQVTEQVFAPPRVAAAVGRAEPPTPAAPRNVASLPIPPLQAPRRAEPKATSERVKTNTTTALIAGAAALAVIVLAGFVAMFFSDFQRLLLPPAISVMGQPKLVDQGAPEKGFTVELTLRHIREGYKIQVNNALKAALSPAQSAVRITIADPEVIKRLKEPGDAPNRREVQIDLVDAEQHIIAKTAVLLPNIVLTAVPAAAAPAVAVPAPPQDATPTQITPAAVLPQPPKPRETAATAHTSLPPTGPLVEQSQNIANDIMTCVQHKTEAEVQQKCSFILPELNILRNSIPSGYEQPGLVQVIESLGNKVSTRNLNDALNVLKNFGKVPPKSSGITQDIGVVKAPTHPTAKTTGKHKPK